MARIGKQAFGSGAMPDLQSRAARRSGGVLPHPRRRRGGGAQGAGARAGRRAALSRALPRTPCVVKRIEPFEEKDAPIAYYRPAAIDGTRPATYYVNTYKPETRARYEVEALAFHESVPGPPHPDRACAGADRVARVSQARGRHRVRGGVGAVHRGACRRAGPVQGRARTSRPAELRRLARQPPGRGYWHPRHGLEPRARDRVLRGERDPRQGQHRQRGRPLHRVAGSGARLQAGRARDPAVADGRRDAARVRSSTSRRSTTCCWEVVR